MEFIITLTDEQVKAMYTDINEDYITIQAWLQNAADNKARQCIDRIIMENTDKQPSKVSEGERLSIIKSLNLKSAAEKQAEYEAHIITGAMP